MKKVAVAIAHGVGVQGPDFAEPMATELTERFAAELDIDVAEAARRLVIEPVHWAPVLDGPQDTLWDRMSEGHLRAGALRRFMIDFVGDGIAYQQAPASREVYDDVHATFARALGRLSASAGPGAPLCVIAHSLGTVIASNYFYDLSKPTLIGESVRPLIADTPLERGETFTLFYTMGSPLAVWALHHEDFGRPIPVPSADLAQHHPGLRGEWVNYYDRDDVIGFPLKPLNDAYDEMVTRDEDVNVGGALVSWNPASHLHYWTDNDVTIPMARRLAGLWREIDARDD